MTTFSQSITFSKDNFDSINTVKKISYNHSVFQGDKIWSTNYKNKMDHKCINETFNKLYKDGNNIYEKIGNSQTKNSWIVKEFLNTVLEKEYEIVGPVCESADSLAKNRKLKIEEGSVIAIHDVGAYGSTMASNYNTRLRPPEIMVDGSDVRLIKRRETFEELISFEDSADEN